MKYEGGSLNLDQGRLTVTLTKTQILLTQGKEIHSVPVKTITEISYGNDVHRRVGAAVALGFFTLGVGALLALAKSKKHYVGMTWADKENPSPTSAKGGFVFKVGKGDYRGFITTLEGMTGLKAVNTDTASAAAAPARP